MAIKDNNAVEEVITKKDHIFLQDMLIAQERVMTEDDAPHYTVTINYKRYSIDTDGSHEYSAKPEQIQIRDFQKKAMIKAVSGDTTLVNALGAIQLAISDILNDQTDMDTTVI